MAYEMGIDRCCTPPGFGLKELQHELPSDTRTGTVTFGGS